MIHSPLFEEIRNYLTRAGTDKQIFLYVPYIKTSTLEKLIDGIENKIIIITNWSRKNLRSSSSDLTLYPFCKERKITLYNNEKIHLKVYSVNLENMILATGNISQHGLMQGGNVELATFIEEISIDDRLFLEQIRSESTRINDEFYEERAKYLQENPPISPEEEPLTTPEPITKDEFLISALPMTRDISILRRAYDRLNQGLSPNDDQEISDCVYHDLSNYGIKLGHSQDEFLYLLKEKFFAHPFIQRIDQFLTPSGQFGQIKQWVQENCTDVPIPSRRELTGNIQVLFEWFEKLGDGKYGSDVPGSYSQRLTKLIPDAEPISEKYDRSYRKKLKETVILGLKRPGKTIDQIKLERTGADQVRIGGEERDEKQKEYRDSPIWHYKTEIDEFVIKELNIPDEIVNERFPSRDDFGQFYMDIVHEISDLRNAGLLVDWNHGVGIWRLIENVTEKQSNATIKTNVVLFSVAGDAALNHFVQTILKDVSTTNFPTSDMKKFPKVRMWGSIDRATNLNRSKWSRLRKGDILLFFREKKYVTKMVIDGTEDNYDISKMIWGEKIDHETMNVESRPGETWQLIMYGSSENVTQTNVNYQDLNKLLGYKEKFMPTRIMDFTIVKGVTLEKLRAKYGSVQKALESIGL